MVLLKKNDTKDGNVLNYLNLLKITLKVLLNLKTQCHNLNLCFKSKLQFDN
jgi:hypothetical protein